MGLKSCQPKLNKPVLIKGHWPPWEWFVKTILIKILISCANKFKGLPTPSYLWKRNKIRPYKDLYTNTHSIINSLKLDLKYLSTHKWINYAIYRELNTTSNKNKQLIHTTEINLMLSKRNQTLKTIHIV